MTITSITGTIMRALPTQSGVEIKLATESGSRTLSVPAARGDLVMTVRNARMTGLPITIRHTEDDVVVGTAAVELPRAA